MSSSHCNARISFILLCSGRGSDYQSYRPKMQESQWWMRRDALVRCTCASLYGSLEQEDVELFLMYDEDLSLMKMKRMSKHRLTSSSNNSSNNEKKIQVPPSEEHIIRAWRKAAEVSESNVRSKYSSSCIRPSSKIQMHGIDLEMECIRDAWENELLHLNHDNQIKESSANNNNDDEKNSKENEKSINNLQMLMNINTKEMNKRALLEHLQNACHEINDLEFLRKHHLNSSPNVILRKMNQKKILKIFNEWKQTKKDQWNKTKNPIFLKETNHNEKKDYQKLLELTFQFILRPDVSTSSLKNLNDDTIVVVLHENCKYELECFGIMKKLREKAIDGTNVQSINKISYSNKRIFVVLGAVRDMHDKEYLALNTACTVFDIPLIGCHLGKTPEFTSKIITAFVNHHCTMKLLIPALHLLRTRIDTDTDTDTDTRMKYEQEMPNQKKKTTIIKSKNDDFISILFGSGHKQKRNEYIHSAKLLQDKEHMKKKEFATMQQSTMKLHSICIVPMLSSSFTTDFSKRNVILWSLVRITVCALWRSRLASSTTKTNKDNSISGVTSANTANTANTTNASFQNSLSFLFLDGIHVTINQHELVQSMANAHQAAPSEYQILNVLLQMLDNTYDVDPSTHQMHSDTSPNWDSICEKIITSEINSNHHLLPSSTLHSSTFVYAIDFSESSFCEQNMTQSNKRSILDHAYESPCDCEIKNQSISQFIQDEEMRGYDQYKTNNTHKHTNIVFNLFQIQHFDEFKEQTTYITNRNNHFLHILEQIYNSITKCFKKYSIPLIKQSWYNNSIDSSAIAITMIQHLHYHNRLIPVLKMFHKKDDLMDVKKSRKKKRKKKPDQKKRNKTKRIKY